MATLIGFNIDEELRERLRKAAFETRQTQSKIFRDALTEYLNRVEAEEF